MLRHIYTYFTRPEFDALWRAASMRQSERTEHTENSAKAQPEAEEVGEEVVEEVN